jgi:hypothetical protein
MMVQGPVKVSWKSGPHNQHASDHGAGQSASVCVLEVECKQSKAKNSHARCPIGTYAVNAATAVLVKNLKQCWSGNDFTAGPRMQG